MVTRRSLLAGAAASTVGGVLLPTAAYVDYRTIIDPAKGYGTWEGWGASLAWWANVFGMNGTLADLLYSRGTVSYRGRGYPGLGLNIVRYNVGACAWQPAGNPPSNKMVVSPNIWRYKQIEGYWLNWYSSDPASDSWDWRVDAEQRTMLALARDRGANLIEFFSDSPMWWMCINHNPSGAANGGDNLQSWNYRQHAGYLATVARYAQDHWGVNVHSIAPFNEPSASWWRADGTQEGCHISRNIQQQVIAHLRAELDARGLGRVVVAASDETNNEAARATWQSFPPATKAKVGRVNAHGYGYGNLAARKDLYQAVHTDGTPLWQSEYGEGFDHGLNLAYHLSMDLRYLHPTAWSYWQPIDGSTQDGSWGLINATYTDPARKVGTLGEVKNKYFVLAQYCRHIRPGMRIIDSGDQATAAAYDAASRLLVLVTVRGDSRQRITYDLSRFGTVGGAGGVVRRWTTAADPGGALGKQYVASADITLSGKQFTVDFDPYVIQTFEIDNVTI